MQAVVAQVKAAKREAKAAASLILQQELKARRRVLRRLGYVAFPPSTVPRRPAHANIAEGRFMLTADPAQLQYPHSFHMHVLPL